MLECREVWKLDGDDPEGFFSSQGQNLTAEIAQQARSLSRDQVIGALFAPAGST